MVADTLEIIPTEKAMKEPPALLTPELILAYYVPIGRRTFWRWISEGGFPKADIAIGAKVRFWHRATVEDWIKARAEGAK